MKNLLKLCVLLLIIGCKSEPKTDKNKTESESNIESNLKTPVKVVPIEHATFIMEWEDEIVYVDPTGGTQSFEDYSEPTLILITDIHGDHFDLKTLNELPKPYDIVAPQAVYNKMPQVLQSMTKVLNNGQKFNFHGFNINGIPMYNITEERLKFHEKGRGNGYVLERNNYKVYISGDTEDIPEMRNLKGINLAFICMNLPYTMTPEAAADATLDFKPKTVIPYHYRGTKNGERYFYDVDKFKKMVNSKNEEINVELMNWYPN